MAITYHNDKVIKLEYNPQDIYEMENINIIGADENAPAPDIEFDDNNAIFVNKNGNDNNTGTQNQPVATIEKAITLCDSNKNYIVITDSEVYEENNLNITQYVDGIYGAVGQAPTIKPKSNNYIQHLDDLNKIIDYKELNINITGKVCRGTWQLNGGVYLSIFSTNTYNSSSYYYEYTNYYCIYNIYTQEVLKPLTQLPNKQRISSNAVLNTAPTSISVVPLDDGSFIIFYVWYDETASYYALKYGNQDTNYTYEKTVTLATVSGITSGYGSISTIKINDNKIIVLYTYTLSSNLRTVFKAMEINSKLGVVKAAFTIYSPSSDWIQIGNPKYLYDNGKLIIFADTYYYTGSYYNYYCYFVYDYANKTMIKTRTVIASLTFYLPMTGSVSPLTMNDNLGRYVDAISIEKLSNGNYIISYPCGSSNVSTYGRYEYIIIDGDGNIIVNKTTITTETPLGYILVTKKFIDGGFTFMWTTSPSNNTRLEVTRYYDDVTMMYSVNKILNDSAYSPLNIKSGDKYDNEVVIIYRYNNKIVALSFTGCLQDGIYVNKNITFYNVKLVNDYYTVKRLLKVNGDLTLQYCNCTSKKDNSNINHIIAYVQGGLQINNSLLYYSDEGITCTEANNIICEYSVFYYVMYNYVLKLSSINTKTITINKCTFFNNYGGINIDTALISGEVKNSVFHNQSSHDILVNNNTGDVNVSYCCYTGDMSGVASITNSKTINPLFVDEGVYNINNVDLHLKSVYGGYPVNSPAIGMADDSGDAGAYIVSYIITEQTRDEIYLPKPLIQITYQPVNAIQTVSRTGQIFTKRDGLQKVYILTWKSMLIDDFNKLLDVIKCGKNSIYLYPDPISNNDFINCTLIYDSLSGSPQYPAQFETGVFDCVIKLAHEVVD